MVAMGRWVANMRASSIAMATPEALEIVSQFLLDWKIEKGRRLLTHHQLQAHHLQNY